MLRERSHLAVSTDESKRKYLLYSQYFCDYRDENMNIQVSKENIRGKCCVKYVFPC